MHMFLHMIYNIFVSKISRQISTRCDLFSCMREKNTLITLHTNEIYNIY